MKPQYITSEEIKFVYDSNLKRLFGKRLPIHIFGTGSTGNSFFFKNLNLLIDLGFAMKKYKEWDEDFFNNVDNIILTHEHGDHFNPSTFCKAMAQYPHITAWMTQTMYNEITKDTFKAIYETAKDEEGNDLLYGYDDLYDEEPKKLQKAYARDALGNKIIKKSPFKDKILKLQGRIQIINDETPVGYDIMTRNRNIILYPYIVKHGEIINMAIGITDIESGKKLLYVSDLDNLNGESTFTDKNGKMKHVSGVPQTEKFDYLYVEANHDEQILANWMAMHEGDYGALARAKSSLRHLSEKETREYVKNHITSDGLFINRTLRANRETRYNMVSV